MIDLTNEIQFQTSRSGGKGGQNVNKVETAVTAGFHVTGSRLLSENQKQLLLEKLRNRINSEGWLQVRSQTHRTQLANRQEALERLHGLIDEALRRKKPRIATHATKSSQERRIQSKKRKADIKAGRQKFRPGDL
ncbi:MAG TPA: alternative ribosome rescue aminoacyl-tRNA hydrolase ArfB [Chitinophagaceae bacterium]|nr:alternative ribosome rescue aminoacyl-tRNA hydrolase ArfB [Chitinophagaceae bacterium]